MSNGHSTGIMSIEVNDMPANAELSITLETPGFSWSAAAFDPNSSVSLSGGFPLISATFTAHSIDVSVGGENSSFSIGVPISYPGDILNPTAHGSLTINPPGTATVLMMGGGPQKSVEINAPWTLSFGN